MKEIAGGLVMRVTVLAYISIRAVKFHREGKLQFLNVYIHILRMPRVMVK